MLRPYKRMMISFLIIITFIGYYLGTDPDTEFFKDLSYGVGLMMTLQIFIIATISFWVIEVIPDLFVDIIYGKEKELVDKAKQTSDGASRTLIAKSIRIMAYAIIVSASIISFNVQ